MPLPSCGGWCRPRSYGELLAALLPSCGEPSRQLLVGWSRRRSCDELLVEPPPSYDESYRLCSPSSIVTLLIVRRLFASQSIASSSFAR